MKSECYAESQNFKYCVQEGITKDCKALRYNYYMCKRSQIFWHKAFSQEDSRRIWECAYLIFIANLSNLHHHHNHSQYSIPISIATHFYLLRFKSHNIFESAWVIFGNRLLRCSAPSSRSPPWMRSCCASRPSNTCSTSSLPSPKKLALPMVPSPSLRTLLRAGAQCRVPLR